MKHLSAQLADTTAQLWATQTQVQEIRRTVAAHVAAAVEATKRRLTSGGPTQSWTASKLAGKLKCLVISGKSGSAAASGGPGAASY